MNIKEKFWVGTFISLWVLVSTVSTFHSVEFFGLSNNLFLSWCIAIGFEIGAMASLGGLLIDKGNKTIVWMLFIILTAFQIHGNMYWAWSHAGDISEWSKLFDLVEEDPNFTKRVFAFISGGILPLISLGFIKSLMDYMKPKDEVVKDKNDTQEEKTVENTIEDIEENKNELQEDDSLVNLETEIDIPENTPVENDNFEKWSTSESEDLMPDELFELGKQEPEPIDYNPLPRVLNKEIDPTKLGDIIDNAENTVNSIGEK